MLLEHADKAVTAQGATGVDITPKVLDKGRGYPLLQDASPARLVPEVTATLLETA